MLRVVFIILAIATITLAIVLGQMLLYFLAVVLIAGVAILTTRKLQRAHNDIPESFMKAPVPPEVDLSSLGIVDIRPKADKSHKVRQQIGTDLFDSVKSPSYSDANGEPESDHFNEDTSFRNPDDLADDGTEYLDPESLPIGVEPATAVSRVKTRRTRATILVSQASSTRLTSVMLPALTSMRASLNAYTICLLKKDARPLKYHVEAIVSQNSYARPQGCFALTEPMVLPGNERPVSIYPARAGLAVPAGLLGYYHEHIPVEQLAVVEFSGNGRISDYVMVVDSMEPGVFDQPPAMQMLEQYAGLIHSILETELNTEASVETRTVSGSETGVVRPRREIIREEMELARAQTTYLSLALVFLNSGEKMASATTEEIDIVETEFELRLKAVATEGIVEHFGELTYGVFFHGPPENVAAWAGNLQSSFAHERGLLEGGVSVGVAILGERHTGPDEFRAEATAALKEAFDSGECTIVG
jgi:hypothetical protein